MIYYFQTPDGVYLTGWTLSPQMDDGVIIMEHYVIITNPPQDMLDHPKWYKVENGEPVKLSIEEVNALYPDLQPTFEEQQTDFNLDVDYRLSCIELGLV